MEDCSPKKIDEPWPACAFVVITGCVEAQPRPAPPVSMYFSKARLCSGFVGDPLSQMINWYCFKYASFRFSQSVVASKVKLSLGAMAAKNFSAPSAN